MNKRKLSMIALSLAVVGAAATVPVVMTGTANAQQTLSTNTADVTIPVNTIVRGDKGEEKVITTKDVANGEYTVHVIATNQESVHPNTDIIVRSSGSEVSVKDVERTSFLEEQADGTLTVTDGKVTVLVKLGKDKVFSGGVKVVLKEVEKPEEPQEPAKGEDKPQVKATVTVLPETGMANVAGLFTGVSGLGYAAHRAINRKRK